MESPLATEPSRARSRGHKLWPVGVALLTVLGIGGWSRSSAALIWPTESIRIEADLAATDPAIRRRAARRIRELPNKIAWRVLDRSLDDDDLQVRLLALDAAKELEVPDLAERVLGWLTESESRLRLAAAELCASDPSPRAVAPLSRALSDVDPEVRAAAANALGRSGSSEAVVGLLGRLDDVAVEVAEAVIRALARLADPRAVVPLVAKIEDPRAPVRRAVTRALGELGDRRAVSALVLALRDQDWRVRAGALVSLGALGDPSATASITVLLSEEAEPEVRRSAIQALGRLGTPEAVAHLTDAFGDAHDDREDLVRAIAAVGPAAGPILKRCIHNSRDRVRAEGCASALALSSTPGAKEAILGAARGGLVGLDAALEGLSELGDPAGLPLAMEVLSDRDASLRRAARRALQRLLDPNLIDGRAVEPLQLAFRAAHATREERIELLGLLGRTGSPRAAHLLVPIARTALDLEYRLAAIRALGSIRDRAVPSALLEGLSDPEAGVRLNSALSIRKNGAGNIATELLDRFERAGREDRELIALALPGTLRRIPDQGVERLLYAAFQAQDGVRDGLIEAVARVSSERARSALVAFSKSEDPADRAKAAESMTLGSGDSNSLVALAKDADPAVRANAIWSLGAVGGERARTVLLGALSDLDVVVRANAAAAVGRLSLRVGSFPNSEICTLLKDPRAAVRANALGALRLVGRGCGAAERNLLTRDRSARVRRAAADLLRDTEPDDADAKALRDCAAWEPDGSVAAACQRSRAPRVNGDSDVLLFVVPANVSTPIPRAPFALRRPDLVVRHGWADRRGAVREGALTDGPLELEVPAPLDD